jgi:hypothetical protein
MNKEQDEYISPLLGRPYTKEEKERDYQNFLALVKEHGWHIDSVPDRLITSEMVLIAINLDSSVLEILPERFKTKEVCLIAARKKGFALKYVPKEILDEEILFEGLKCGTCKLDAVPKEHVTPKLIVYYYFSPSCISRFLDLLPEEFLGMAPSLETSLKYKRPFEELIEDCEKVLLKEKSIEELLTHSHPWFRAQGLKIGVLNGNSHLQRMVGRGQER